MASLVECHTASEVFENYKAVRARFRALKAPPPPPPPPIPEPPPAPVIRRIEITEMPQATMIAVHIQEADAGRIIVHPSVGHIIAAVCKKYRVSRGELLSHRRTADIVRPRQIAMYLAKQLTLRSFPDIGRRMGDRDHTTILHGFNKIARLRTSFPELDKDLTELETILGGGNG